MAENDDNDAESSTDETTAGDATEDGDASNGGIGSILRGLLETIAEADPGSETTGRGRLDIGRASIGHDVSVGVGTLDEVTDADRRRIGGLGVDVGADVSRGVDASDPNTTPATGEHPTHVRYNEDGTEAIVVIDVPEIEPEHLSAGVSSRNGDLLAGTDEKVLQRVPLRSTGFAVVAASYHNGVLELHLSTDSDRTDTTGGERS